MKSAIHVDDFAGAERERILTDGGDGFADIFRRSPTVDRSEPCACGGRIENPAISEDQLSVCRGGLRSARYIGARAGGGRCLINRRSGSRPVHSET